MTKWDAAERKVSLASRHEEVQLIKDVIMRRKELHEKVTDDPARTVSESVPCDIRKRPLTHLLLKLPITPPPSQIFVQHRAWMEVTVS